MSVEDNVETQVVLKKSLESNFQIFSCFSLSSARQFIQNHPVSLVLLDLNLSDGLGLDLCKDLCTESEVPKIPIIVISGRNDLDAKMDAFRAGADDYIVKPFEKDELNARIYAVLRRGPLRNTEEKLEVADVCMDINRQTAYLKRTNKMINLHLTPIEFKVLLNICKKNGTEISREAIRSHVWAEAFVSTRIVDAHISKLRRKLEGTQIEINNKRGIGYYLSLRRREFSKNYLNQILELPAFGIKPRVI